MAKRFSRNIIQGLLVVSFAAMGTFVFPAPARAGSPDYELKVSDAKLIVKGQPAKFDTGKNTFGPSRDGVTLGSEPPLGNQLRWTVQAPEGDYCIGQLLLGDRFFDIGEFRYQSLQIYLNDTRLTWTSYTLPRKPENAAEQNRYQAELRVEKAVHLKPGDTLRLVQTSYYTLLGPMRLYKTAPAAGEFTLGVPDNGRPQNQWIVAQWAEPKRQGPKITQDVTLYNPGVLPHTFKLEATVKDFIQSVLLRKDEQVTIPPGDKITKTYEFDQSDYGTSWFTLVASSDQYYMPLRLVKYYVEDRTAGARPNTCLNGEWEMCYAPGVELAQTPPQDAKWEKIMVPSFQPTLKGHCGWYRKTFQVPAQIHGERAVLRFDEILTEAHIFVNSKPVGEFRYGPERNEVDITAAFLPGQKNEILVGVRDWLAYSAKNRQRVLNHEDPIYKDSMEDIAEYASAASIGIGASVYLESRPAVSVDDVTVVTSVRNKTLTVKYRLINTGASDQDVTLSAAILDEGKPVGGLGNPVTVKVPAGKTAEREFTLPWKDAVSGEVKMWWPESPNLYVLATDLVPASGQADRHYQRFGFHEMWIEGISFILNGTRVKIRSQWCSGASGMGAAEQFWEPAKRLEAMFAWQTNCIKTWAHECTRTQQWGAHDAVDIADETGLMMKLESDVNQGNFTFDKGFWDAALAHEVRMIGAYKNHPAINLWSAGNENMWGWIYQGEAAKVLGNRQQIRIVKAMREADPMKRPVEWEADGDLMGGWEHHALHYPREISGFVDVPNGCWWGPLDGKTVVPYSMGPITLGQKPITVGESFWPATLNHPYGETVLIGDDSFKGMGYNWRAWFDSSEFFMHGFRDIEFALIDWYPSPTLIQPQTIILKQEDREFYGGRTLTRDVNVHNDTRQKAAFGVFWRMIWDGKVVTAVQQVSLDPAEMKRLKFVLPLPAVTRPTKMISDVMLGNFEELDKFVQEQAKNPSTKPLEIPEAELPWAVHNERRQWTIYPPLSYKAAPGAAAKDLSVYDPAGTVAAALKKLGAEFTPLSQLKAPEGKALIIAPYGLKDAPQGSWRESLGAFVRNGGKVLILGQEESPDFLPVQLTMVKDRKTTIAFLRAADHPIVQDLTDDDMRWWADDHYVSLGIYRKPPRGNFLPLVDCGTGDGLLESPLMELYDGKGSFIVCQMPLVEKLDAAPQAGVMFANLLGYLESGQCYRQFGATAMIAPPESGLKKMLDDNRIVYQDLAGAFDKLDAGKFQTAIVDSSLLTAPAASALRKFAEDGGHVMIHRAKPAQEKDLCALAGIRLRLLPVDKEPLDIRNRVLRGPQTGLLAGISNNELAWLSNACLAQQRLEGNWGTGFDKLTPEEWICDYFCQPGDDVADKCAQLTTPGTLVQVPVGKGYVLVSQLRLDEVVPELDIQTARLRAMLLTNLGCQARGDGAQALARSQRFARYEYTTMDLSPYATRGLRDDKEKGVVSFSNQGENDLRALPTGRQVLGGVPFEIASTPKAALCLYSNSGANKDLPKAIKGIKVAQKADVLIFLHTYAWWGEKPFAYHVNYDDGTGVDIEIVDKRQVLGWWEDPTRFQDAIARYGAFVAWRGDNPMHKGVLITGYEWVNPHPEKAVRDVDFLTVPKMDEALSGLLGLTVARERPTEGVVTDVIGTRGVKVKLGTEVQDVYYIGTVGVDEKHPFYAKAVEAHKAMVVGKKVLIQTDVVATNSAGQKLAYVFLDQVDVRSLVNGRIIGGGLGKLGNFEGNGRYRMYLENLGFIASQGKVGLWAGSK
jgi:hypothetical protein